MFLLLLSYKKSLAEVDCLVVEHRQYLERYYASGHFLLSGRKEPRTGGVIVANAKSKAELEGIIRDDPFHREQVAEYEIVEFMPSKAATQLAHWVFQSITTSHYGVVTVDADRKLSHWGCGQKLGLVKQESQGFYGVLRG